MPDAASPSSPTEPVHPLLMAAVLVWLSVELIGDGLLALLASTGARSRSSTRQVTPS